MTPEKWYLRAKRHHDELGRLVNPNVLLILDAGDAERLEELVASGNWVQVPDGMTLLAASADGPGPSQGSVSDLVSRCAPNGRAEPQGA